jgi:RND superfamily putative drug exporter
MFARLGSFAAVVLFFAAPNINDVSVSDQRTFLAADTPSLRANDLMKQYFPDLVALSSAVLVVDAGTGGDVTIGDADAFVTSLTTWLTAPDAPGAIDQVWSPAGADDLTKASLISADDQIALITVRFNAIATRSPPPRPAYGLT